MSGRRRLLLILAISLAVVGLAVVIVRASGDDGSQAAFSDAPTIPASPTASEAAPAQDITPTAPSGSATGSTEQSALGDPEPESPTAEDPLVDGDPGEEGAPAPELVPVPVEPGVVNDPIGLDETADLETGLSVRVIDLEAVDGEARHAGEIAGPALRVLVEAVNGGGETISLARVQIDLAHGADLAPGVLLSGPDVEPFPMELPPGETAVAAIVFGVPPERRDRVQILFSHTAEAPTVVFEGAAP